SASRGSVGSDEGIAVEDEGVSAAGDDEGIPVLRLDVSQSNTSFDPGTAEGSDQEAFKQADFVYVVDSSPWIVVEQDKLVRSYPGFISAIEQSLDIDDFNLMVVDAGRLSGSGACDGTLGAGQIADGSGRDCGVSSGRRFVTTQQADLVEVFSCMASR